MALAELRCSEANSELWRLLRHTGALQQTVEVRCECAMNARRLWRACWSLR